MSNISEALAAFRAYIEPQDGLGDNPFKLACSFSAPATAAEIDAAFPGGGLPAEIRELWAVSRETRLFEDVEYGQWGLMLLPPSASAERMAHQRSLRPGDYRAGDLIIGEFRGDLDLLVMASSEEGERRVLVALPLDKREDWYPAGSSLAEFLERYLEAYGDKYWENLRCLRNPGEIVPGGAEFRISAPSFVSCAVSDSAHRSIVRRLPRPVSSIAQSFSWLARPWQP